MRFLFIIVFLCASQAAIAGDNSVISLPISARLSALQDYANANLPVDLDRRRHGQRCVEPERVCVRVPEFRGLRVTFKDRCVEATPAIDCDIDHHVWRQGDMSLSADGGRIIIKQAVGARVTVRGRGDIGRHIRETVNGSAEFTIVATPSVASDWSPNLDIDVSFRWINRPEAKLFNVISITFGGEAEKAIKDAVAKFKSETLPAELAKLNLRDEAASIWAELQNPIMIAIPDSEPLFLHVRPETAGLAPIVSDGVSLQSAISLAGQTLVTDTSASPFASRTDLPPLTKPQSNGVSVHLPVSVQFAELSTRLAQELPLRLDVDGFGLSVRELAISGRDGRLVLDMDVGLSQSGAGIYSGPLRANVLPAWDRATQTLDYSDLVFERTGGLKNAAFVALANSEILRSWIVTETTHSFWSEIDQIERELSAALNGVIAPGLRLSSSLDLEIVNIEVGDALTVALAASGSVRVAGFSLGN